jgi:glycosyltransferase involved in cell wall biosynthesis
MSGASGRRVLYVNQIGQMSGAERSLLDLLGGLPPDLARAVACPQGELAERLRERGVETYDLPATDASFRLHPLHTARGVAWVGRAGLRVRALARRFDATLVHANSTRAGLAAVSAARTGGRPAVVHVRDWAPPTRFAALTLRYLEAGAAAIVPNSRYVAAQLPRGGGRATLRVIHDAVDVGRFDPRRIDRDAARQRIGLAATDEVIAVIAQLTPWKGQEDTVRLVGELKPARPGLRLLLAGSAKFTAPGSRYDNLAYERRLADLIRSLGLEREVLLLGERDDVPQLLRATDVLLVPSWQEAFGRIAVEGMAMGLPVVATSEGGPAEIVRDGVDGTVLPPRDPQRWAAAVDELLRNPELRAEIGRRGRERALAEFSVARHVDALLGLYREVAADSR